MVRNKTRTPVWPAGPIGIGLALIVGGIVLGGIVELDSVRTGGDAGWLLATFGLLSASGFLVAAIHPLLERLRR